MIHPILAAGAGTAIGAIVPIVVVAVTKKIKSSVDLPIEQGGRIAALEKRTARLEDATVLLVDLQDTELGALTALLQATKGQCNGNIQDALDEVSGGRSKYQKYLKGART